MVDPPSVHRDRDATGRARNARPRDAAGRPLPYGSPDVPRQPEGVVRSPGETVDAAQRLLDARVPFQAHEVFEDAWKASTGLDRGLWKGLAQLAVGLTHLDRGNLRGAKTLLRRGIDAIAPFGAAPANEMDVAGIVGWATDLAARLDAAPAAADVAWIPPTLVSVGCQPAPLPVPLRLPSPVQA
jgi:hypothetical protein